MSDYIGNKYETTNYFKSLGEFEKEGKEPLPPTPISEEAYNKLKSWDLDENQIEAIQSFSSQFRYDCCNEKAKRLSEQPAEIFANNAYGADCINFPNYMDTDRLDGQCGDIARQWIRNIYQSNLIDYLNENLSTNKEIVPSCYIGQSKTHFTSRFDDHLWNGLSLLTDGKNVSDEVYIDSSFQHIDCRVESGYYAESSIYKPEDISIDENVTIPIGTFSKIDNDFSYNIKRSIILGISENFKNCIGFSFLEDESKDIIPIVYCKDHAGRRNHYILENDSITNAKEDEFSIDKEEEDEIKNILLRLSKIEYVKNEPTIVKIETKLDNRFMSDEK